MPYTIGKLKRRAFQQEDTAPGSLKTKSREFLRVSRECLRATPTTQGGVGVLQKAAEAYVLGTSPSGGEKPLLVPFELTDKPLIRITNRK